MTRDQLFQDLEKATLHIAKGMHQQIPEAYCSPAQSHMLMVIAALEPTTVKGLAEQLAVTSGAATQHIEELERLGLASRATHPDDRRKVVITLTKRGRETAATIRAFKRKMLNDLFENLNDDELATLVALMQKTCERKGEKS